jgi:hypothetical protein
MPLRRCASEYEGVIHEHEGYRHYTCIRRRGRNTRAACFAVPESADPEGRHFDLSGQALGALALGGLALAAIASHKGGLGWTVGLLVAVLTLPLFL